MDGAAQTCNTLKGAGGNIKFSLLPGHDHDVWTDTYSDPAFYDWLLAEHRYLPVDRTSGLKTGGWSTD